MRSVRSGHGMLPPEPGDRFSPGSGPAAPYGQHVGGVPATDVDGVLVQQELPHVADLPVEEREVGRLRAPGEGRVEMGNVALGVAARGPQEAAAEAFGLLMLRSGGPHLPNRRRPR